MLRFVTLCAVAVAAVSAAPGPYNIFLNDITPEEAQKYLNAPPFVEPQLSTRTAVLPLVKYNDPRFRAADSGPTLGHYWKNGHEIENTDDYVEEVYNAAQYHGQDGLGSYAYGYETPESSKVENRVGSGNVQGAYTYRDGNNELIKVRYWADSEGFHQEDNRPQVVLEPVQETEEVRQARLEHEAAWKAAAAANLLQPVPQNQPGNYYPDYQPSASEQLNSYVRAPRQQSPQFQVPSQAPVQREAKAYGQLSLDQASANLEEAEPTGPPHGFFYSFTYPVSDIVLKSQANGGAVNPGKPVDYDTVAVNAQRS